MRFHGRPVWLASASVYVHGRIVEQSRWTWKQRTRAAQRLRTVLAGVGLPDGDAAELSTAYTHQLARFLTLAEIAHLPRVPADFTAHPAPRFGPLKRE